MRNRRGFTLAELLTLLAVGCCAICIVVPTLAQVRGPGDWKTRSTANLRLHGQVLGLYANTHRGAVLNPFRADGSLDRPWDVSPEWVDGAPFMMEHDAYSYHWGDLIRHYYEDYERADVFAAPGDQETLDWFDEYGYLPTWVADISYWYSPTVFFGEQRFAEADGGDTATGATPRNLRRNDVADMTFPSRKVVILEKQDFATPEKLLFSHPAARVGLLFGDNSVRVSDNQPLYDAIDADPTLAPSGGNWADEEGLERYYMDNDASPDELLEDQQHLYPAFYMWTRDGVRGRDLF
jgi:hypothetical protein